MLHYACAIVALGVITNLTGPRLLPLRGIGKSLTFIARHSGKQSSIGFQPVFPGSIRS
jgi:hypothetical protein